jgi:hypothetical protein
VAIVQISRITARKGLQEDLPQPLAGAELGWAIDDRRLFIGNGTLEEGAPVVGNTEVLTEFSDLLGYTTQYTYKGEVAGYTAQTGPTSGAPVTQSLQSRLDSYVVVTDFGATGNGLTDDTAAINRALYQLYCIQDNSQVRRSLYFPAGTYVISDTIEVPPYARLYGNGANSSILSFQVQNWTANTAYAEGVLVYYVAGSAYYRSIAEVPATSITIVDTNYWAVTTLPPYVLRTADSLQQTGINISTNGATPPTNIQVSGMSIQTNQIHDCVLIENATNSFFDSVDIIGPLTTTDLNTNIDDIAAVRWASTLSLVCQQINWTNCRFSGFTYGTNTNNTLTNTNQQVKGCTISNSQFDTLFQGIVLGDSTPVNGGPTGFEIMHNVFDIIYNEGVSFGDVSLNASGYNIFYDVANHFNGTSLPAAPVILIAANNNISVGDMFQRTTANSAVYPRIKIFNSNTQVIPSSIGVDSAAQVQQGSYIRETGTQVTLVAGSTNATVFTKDSTYIKALKMDYTIVRESSVRTGTMTIANDADDSAGDGLSYSDDYVQNSDPDVTLNVTDSGSTMTVLYTASSTRGNGIIYYSLTHLGLSS